MSTCIFEEQRYITVYWFRESDIDIMLFKFQLSTPSVLCSICLSFSSFFYFPLHFFTLFFSCFLSSFLQFPLSISLCLVSGYSPDHVLHLVAMFCYVLWALNDLKHSLFLPSKPISPEFGFPNLFSLPFLQVFFNSFTTKHELPLFLNHCS